MSSKKRAKRNRTEDEFKVKFSTLNLILLLYCALVSLVPAEQCFLSVPLLMHRRLRRLYPVFVGERNGYRHLMN